ncbi:MAG: AmmeMemoRadiSam system protein B [Candidatus Omnitrophica bacterium]|nr:AmmeMemoRadiSam system protein B [Candidatus Omnitrophota bacterium]MCM8777556.1 AmmeMemoRadiSam system protein B [Candidatus Omnitrophota bacterium]
MEKIRRPVVAGYFYPEEKGELLRMLERFIDSSVEPEKATALIAPHAGYVYSGKTAGDVFSRVAIPDTVILIGPNHTGYGEPYAVDGHTIWFTPLGEAEVDTDVVDTLVKKSRYLQKDTVAHIKEHSLEVELPFIQFLKKDVKIVPVILSGYVDDPAWYEIGECLAETIDEKGMREKTLIVTSTDMTHYEEQSIAEEKDNYAIEAILALDEILLIDRLTEKNISMCGYGPVITAIIAAKNLGAKEAELVRYTTSGEVNKDYAQVVGYAGIIIK